MFDRSHKSSRFDLHRKFLVLVLLAQVLELAQELVVVSIVLELELVLELVLE
jgi:hypothetical protein